MKLIAPLHFVELRQMLEAKGVSQDKVEISEFDPPKSGKGSVFPVSHGLLSTMGKNPDVSECDIIVADGKKNFIDAITEFEKGNLDRKHLNLLCCDGCIMGPGMSKTVVD